jgi:hypothetical protein
MPPEDEPEAFNDAFNQDALETLVAELRDSGMSDNEIEEQLRQAQEQQTGRVVDDWREAASTRDEDSGKVRETWEIPAGVDDQGTPILIETIVEEPDESDAILVSLAEAKGADEETWNQAIETALRATIVKPQAFRVFSNHLSEDEHAQYEDEDNKQYPLDHVDAFWTMPPSYRTTLEYRLLGWLGFNQDFFAALQGMATGQTTRQQTSSTLSDERIQSLLETSSEALNDKAAGGTSKGSSGSTGPSEGASKGGAPSGSKTSTGVSGTSPSSRSEGKTQNLSSTQSNEDEGSVVEPAASSDE